MDNFFSDELNKHTLEALEKGKAFFMQTRTQIPIISNSFTGNPITGANYFNLKLSNDLNGTSHTEYVKMNEALEYKSEWISKLPDEERPKGALYQEENMTKDSRYSFVVPTAELNQDIFRDNSDSQKPRKQYVPFQSSDASMENFTDFVQEQFTNAINAALTGTVYRCNIRDDETDRFKSMLTDMITKVPDFMTNVTNKAHQNVMDYQYVPFDKKQFIEKARVEDSYEFNQLNSAITNHVEDIFTGKKPSFNKEFNELAQPLLDNIENHHTDDSNRKPVISRETTEFVKENLKQDKPASVLADTFVGTFVEKANKLAKVGKKVFSGVALACSFVAPALPLIESVASIHPAISLTVSALSLIGKGLADSRAAGESAAPVSKDEYRAEMALDQTAQFVKSVMEKTGGNTDITPETQSNTVIKVAENIIEAQSLKGDATLRSSRNNGDSLALFTNLNKTIRDNPKALDQAVSQLDKKPQRKTTVKNNQQTPDQQPQRKTRATASSRG